MQTARLFVNGRSQAVRLPKEYRFKGEMITDFLPPPEKLARKEPKVKITITLNSGSVDFFKKHAEKNNVKYQTMINEVLDRYVQKYSGLVR